MRTDKDSWDITTSVGSTALFVAAARALEARKAEPLAVDPYAEVFCRAVGGEWADLVAGGAPDHKLNTAFGAHFVNFQGARTRFFDGYFADAAEAGVRQIVLLAAGLDSRAYRLAWPDDTVVFELDQPAVLDFKRQALSEQGARPVAERREIPVDLRDDWPQALRAGGFDPAAPSAWLAEGLLIYLPATTQHQLFVGLDGLAAAGSRLAVEEGAPMPAEVFEAKRREEKAAGEDGSFFTLVYNEQHAPAAQWFTEQNWSAEETTLVEYLDRVGRPLPGDDPDASPMVDSITLVSAVKRRS